jgi:hypothetical protein
VLGLVGDHGPIVLVDTGRVGARRQVVDKPRFEQTVDNSMRPDATGRCRRGSSPRVAHRPKAGENVGGSGEDEAMTSRSLESGESAGTDPTDHIDPAGVTGPVEPVEPLPAGPVERIGLPGQPDGTASGSSHPDDVMTTPQLRAHADELGYSPQDQVRWLAPVQLTRTAVQVLLASAFSTFTDKREMQRSFGVDPLALAPDADGGCWIDYTADTGDGFDSTYTVASLLASAELEVTGPDGEAHRLPRGRLLVLGGDEVYPTASSERYEDRLKGPLRTALHPADVSGWTDSPAPGEGPPLLLALPGNHDWYDGLTAFLRVFGQRRRIGGWQTVQGRSYFVMQLPGGWWLAGLDSQLGSEIDDPQLDFFRAQLTERLQPGDGVILCCASPAWVRTEVDARAFDSFNYFERTVVTHYTDPATGHVRATGAQVRLWITGDLHHYARYQEDPDLMTTLTRAPGAPSGPAPSHPRRPGPGGSGPGQSGHGESNLREAGPREAGPREGGPDRLDPHRPGAARQLITCGLGGAYLSGTHHLPPVLTLPPAGSTERQHTGPAGYRLATRWPSAPDSRRLVPGLLSPSMRGLPFRNPGFWRLAAWVHAFIFLLLISLLGVVRQQGPIKAVRAAPMSEIWGLGGQLVLWWAVAMAVSMTVLSLRAKRLRPPALAVPAVGLQVGVGLLALAAAIWVVRAVTLPGWFPGGRALPNYLLLALLLAVIGPVAGLVGSYGVALTLALSRSRRVEDWQFSAQSIDDRKGFVRLRITPDGSLVVYPLAVDRVARRWRIEDGGGRSRPARRVTAAGGLPAAHLIEEPVVILRAPEAAAEHVH